MKSTVNPILSDHLARLNRQFIKQIWQIKNLFSGLGSRSSGYRNTICDQYVRQIEKIGNCIFTYLTPAEKLTPNLFSQIFSEVYSELKVRLIIDLDGNRNITMVDEAYQRIINRFAYEISLSHKKQVKNEIKTKAFERIMWNSFVQRKENLQNREEILKKDPKNSTTNIVLNNCNICCNENTTDTQTTQSNKKTINPEPENWLKKFVKIGSYVMSLFK